MHLWKKKAYLYELHFLDIKTSVSNEVTVLALGLCIIFYTDNNA